MEPKSCATRTSFQPRHSCPSPRQLVAFFFPLFLLPAERASVHGTDFKPTSKFGHYHHDYEWLISSLKFFSPSTLLSRSLHPLHYHELESWEEAISSQYSSDLQEVQGDAADGRKDSGVIIGG